MCEGVDSFQEILKQVHVEYIASCNELVLYQHTFGGELALLHDQFGCGPRLTKVPLCTARGGGLLNYILSQIKNVAPLLSRQEISSLIHESMSPTFDSLQTLQQKVTNFENFLVDKLSFLSMV